MIQVIAVGPEEARWFAGFLPEQLLKDRPGALLYGAVDRDTGTAVGCALAQPEGSVLRLLGLSVADGWRRRGVGSQLVLALIQDAIESMTITRIQAALVWADPEAERLFRRCGFTLTPQGTAYSLPLAQLLEGPFWGRKAAPPEGLLALEQLPAPMVNALGESLQAAGAEIDLPFRPEQYDGQLSLCITDGSAPVTLLLASCHGDQLYLDYLYSAPGHPASTAAVLREAVRRAGLRFPPETTVSLLALSDAAQELAAKLLPQATQRQSWIAEYSLGAYGAEKGGA